MQIDRHYSGTQFITGLRAIAVFLVFLIHSGGGGLRNVSNYLNNFVDFGKYGVQMFFVISGFTIFYQLNERTHSLKRFLLTRISRISIPYFPILLLTFTYISLGGEQFNSWADKFNDGKISSTNFISHILYISSFDLRYANTIIGVEWTLNIEVFYYLVIGFLVTKGFINKNTINLLLWVILFFCISIIFLFLGYIDTLDMLLIHWMPFQYGWMFIIGGWAYFVRRKIISSLPNNLANKISDIAVIISLLSLVILISISGVGLVNEVIVSLVTATLLSTTRDSAKLSYCLINKPMLHIGSISFSLYLTHYIIISTKFSTNVFYLESEVAIFLVDMLFSFLTSLVWYIIFERVIYGKVKNSIDKYLIFDNNKESYSSGLMARLLYKRS